MTVLVTGGAGYIGAHVVRSLRARGDDVLVVDDLTTGSRDRVPGVTIVQADLADASSVELVASAMRDARVDAVIHLAARKQVEESIQRPAWYEEQNVGGLANLLVAARDAGVRRMVFSSTAAVYGDVEGAVDETHTTAPLSPYGATKLRGEQLLEEAAEADGVSAASLRYFNVGGAGAPELGDTEAHNLIPLVFEALAAGRPPVIFGDDYPTVDGTCVRDYVHVEDVARAHLDVLDALGRPGHRVYNVGTGTGTSVRQMIDRILTETGSDLRAVVEGRRPGDAHEVVADPARIRAEIGWAPLRDVDDIVRSAWASRRYLSARAAG